MAEPSEKRDAFTEFYRRYSSFLFNVCVRSCWSFDSAGHLAEDIFQNVMIKVSEKGGFFKFPADVKEIDSPKYIKAWLGRIARNELLVFLKKNPDEKSLSNPLRKRSSELLEVIGEDVNTSLDEVADMPVTLQKSQLEEGLLSLEDREREILMTYMQYFDPLNPNLHLPEEVLQAICDRYKITSQNVRKIKGRAIDKLKKHLNKK